MVKYFDRSQVFRIGGNHKALAAFRELMDKHGWYHNYKIVDDGSSPYYSYRLYYPIVPKTEPRKII